MSDQDIFKDQESSPTSSDQTQVESKNPDTGASKYEDLLLSIRNPETGEPKYKSIEDALVALKHSQEFIPKLQKEKQDLFQEYQTVREELSKSVGVMEALDRLAQPQAEKESPPAPQAIDERALEDLVEQALNKRLTQKQQAENVGKVKTALKEQFGEKAGEVFYKKAEELGLDRRTMNELAAKSPSAVLAYFKSKENGGSEIKTSTSSVSSEALDNKPKPKFNGALPPPPKSMMAGASTRDLVAELRRHREAVYQKYGIEQ